MRAVCVIGLGLIGGSVLRAAAKAGRQVWGATTSERDAASAVGDGYQVLDAADALRRAAEADALVVVAVPLPAVDGVLRAVAEHAPRALLTDVVSVKRPVVDAVARLAPDARFVAGHPMSGRSASGWASGDATLFHGRPWALCVPGGNAELGTWCEGAGLALDCGAHVVPVEPDGHDGAAARISHLPHVLAAVLASVGADGGPAALALAAGSFTDGTRVAGSDPELVAAMCEGNGAALLPVLDDALGRLGAARGALASTGSLGATLRSGHAGRAALATQAAVARTRISIDLTAQEAGEALLGVGASGGRVVALEGTLATAEVTAER